MLRKKQYLTFQVGYQPILCKVPFRFWAQCIVKPLTHKRIFRKKSWEVNYPL